MELPKDVVSGSPLLSLLRVGTTVRVRNVLRSKGDDSQCCKERDDLFRGEIPGGSGREESHVSMIVTANLEAPVEVGGGRRKSTCQYGRSPRGLSLLFDLAAENVLVYRNLGCRPHC